jgi:hypothetical protein
MLHAARFTALVPLYAHSITSITVLNIEGEKSSENEAFSMRGVSEKQQWAALLLAEIEARGGS